ncbi:hypothetical protein PR001_g17131 [Phytophthora rubi]|uniref:Uncharacterized protein n=1 Tax=Phytophthora rubi TaxID=129364 RepID=A0A6A3KNL6_9STRA|nr:hypothetical protein PR002_g17087 [Phytophthora rubi]KAE9006755.1 hypothetical protein PR001_g17131 [Phytophthora rubi]
MEGKDNDPGQVASDSSFTTKLPGFSDEDAVDDNTLEMMTRMVSSAWSDDDNVELYARVMQRKTEEASSSGASDNASKYWSIRKVGDFTCHLELADKPSQYSVLSEDPEEECKALWDKLRSLYVLSENRRGSTWLTITGPSMNEKIPAIFSQVKKSCEEGHLRRSVALVMEQLRQEKADQLRQRIKDRLTLKTGSCPETAEMKRPIVNQARRIDELAKRIEALEAINTEMSAKLQFGKVLSEMEKKDFGTILVNLALAQREVNATRLGFGKVFGEMKKKDFSRLLEEKSVAKRNAEAAELIVQLLQMEAQRAGIPLGALDIPIVMPEVVAVTGAVSQYSDDIPLATPVPKQI